MRPDGVGALGAATGVLALTGVDGLEVIDVAIGLVEITVSVEVVAVPLVELAEVALNRGNGAERGERVRDTRHCPSPR